MSQLPASPELPKKFYTSVGLELVGDLYEIRLDGRPVRTPARAVLAVRSPLLARELAAEWDAQVDRIDPATMPATRLANTVIDAIAPNPAPVREDLERYAETDLLAYRAEGPERLVARQIENWDPVLRWIEADLGIAMASGQGVMFVRQPPETLDALRGTLATETEPFRLGALHQITTLTGSLLLALAVAAERLDAAEAWRLAHIDEDWNIEQWGEDEEARRRREARFLDMRAAALFLRRD